MARYFKNKAAYMRWLRWGHRTGVFKRTPGHQKVYVGGKLRRVRHKTFEKLS